AVAIFYDAMHKRRAFQASSPNYQAASLWAAFFYPKQSRRLDLNDVIRLTMSQNCFSTSNRLIHGPYLYMSGG
ncbi:hypothetical protein ABTF55_21945, partial [Acinetobacter baumannii]